MRKVATILLLVAAAAAFTAAIATRSRIGHPVTARMRADAGAVAGRPALSLPEAARERPTVLIFIKDGCPCSEAADPCFRRLFTAYGDRVAFLGIIDGESPEAARWTREHDTPYPVIADPDLKVVNAYHAERSAYVALVTQQGTVDRLWPGYSAGMLRELGARLASAVGVPEVRLDVGDAPDVLTSGCTFD
ncbi:Peroxiredoxin [Singulisphaera sp. GP187]|uniref:peroxiredoxin family protein n=1 Tax=Singulisphaera sp. GP187 TaxID=1882752 RepID=UPI0009287E7F|nr:redoxin domain-containing protein [Singulisphaera sp. GP187]SIO64926.1 Peroxiredoxin [Singulisphaera sp. GP187]